MMSNSRDTDPIELLGGANPVPTEALRSEIGAEDHRLARERAIAAGEAASAPGHRRRVPRLGALGAGALAIGAAVAAALVILGGSPVGPGEQPEFARAAVEVAEANPRLLIGAPGWSVTRAGEFDPENGSMVFSDGEHRLTLDWHQPPEGAPAFDLTAPPPSMPELDQWYRVQLGGCLTRDSKPVDCDLFMRFTEIDVLGTSALLAEQRTVFTDRASTDFAVYFPPSGRTTISLRPSSIPRAKLLEVLGSLYHADVETWLAALPPRVVRPLERPEVVDEMLADVPIPASVDIEALKEEATAGTRYQLGARLTGAVACGWLDQWAVAIESGDSALSNEATQAMQTSRDWAILQEMREQGGWSQTVWRYAGEMRRGEREALLGTSGTEEYPDGSVYELSPSYASGLGCDSERRTLRREGSGHARPPGGRAVPVDAPSKP